MEMENPHNLCEFLISPGEIMFNDSISETAFVLCVLEASDEFVTGSFAVSSSYKDIYYFYN